MSLKITKNTIELTRGDSLKVKVTITNNDDEYIPSSDDVIKFGLKRTIHDKKCLVEKEIPYDTMILHLTSEDTKHLEFGDYVYDIQIQFPGGDVNTFINCEKFKILAEVV